STSWRNRPEILHVANAVSATLRAASTAVAALIPAPRVAAPAGASTVRCALLTTAGEEAEYLADRITEAWRHVAGAPPETEPGEIPFDDRPTTAILVRMRAQIPLLEDALRRRGLPVEVVGLGGLLDTPEVRDVVSTLQVLADPTHGAALLRL